MRPGTPTPRAITPSVCSAFTSSTKAAKTAGNDSPGVTSRRRFSSSFQELLKRPTAILLPPRSTPMTLIRRRDEDCLLVQMYLLHLPHFSAVVLSRSASSFCELPKDLP